MCRFSQSRYPLSKLLLFSTLSLELSACGTIGLESYGPDTRTDPTGEAVPGDGNSNASGSPEGDSQDPSESSSPSSDSDPGEAEDTETNESEDVECTFDRFPVAMHQATQDNSVDGQPVFIYQARNDDGTPFDELQILSYQAAPYHGPDAPGTYLLDGSNYADCALCVLLIGDCNDSYQCDQVFFISEGTLSVQSLSDHGGPFRATLKDAVFEEVTIDSTTYETTPVPGGETWCLDEMTIDVTTYVYQ